MKPAVAVPDLEVRAKDDLKAVWSDETAPVGIGGASIPRVEVRLDGVFAAGWPVVASGTIRLVSYATSTSEAKRLVSKAQGLLLSLPGYTFMTGPFPARDPETREEIASATVRLTARTTPL